MTFGIDFDGTLSRDPEFFEEMVNLAIAHSHRCVLVTGNSAEGDHAKHIRDVVGDLMPIVFAGPMWKKEAAAKAGWKIDVWIDDNPEYVAPQMQLGRR